MKHMRRFSLAGFMVLALLVSGARQFQSEPILQVIDIEPILARHDIGNAPALAFNPEANVIYLAHGSDQRGGFIYTLDEHGNLLREIDLQAAYQPEAYPNGLSYDSSSGHVFVEVIVPKGADFESHLLEMDPDTGAVLSDLLLADPGGGIYVADDGLWQPRFGEDVIRHYTREGALIEDISVAASFPGSPGPFALTSSFRGGFLIVDHFGRRIVEVDRTGHEIGAASTADLGDGRALAIDVDLETQRIFLQVNNQVIYVLSSAFIEVGPATISIDIRPGSRWNFIYPGSRWWLPVAILTTDSFDAATVDPTTVRFGVTGTESAPVRSALRDIDRDGDRDMILLFRIRETGIQCGDTSASLTAATLSGQAIEGSDTIRTIGCRFKPTGKTKSDANGP